MRRFSAHQIVRLRTAVRTHYRRFGRRLSWRRTRDPYRILVSEVMLQQTQVDRVVPKYEAFIQRFPTVQALASASQRDILRFWQGLGYNRRALLLHRATKQIVELHRGKVPRTHRELESLPGIGEYAAAAILIFAYNMPVVCIETNIRAAFIHHFFPRSRRVLDVALLPLIERALDRKNPRVWYSALMDYGAMLKREGENPSRRSAHHVAQKPFRGSRREVRGRILRFLMERGATSITAVRRELGGNPSLVEECIGALVREGFLVRTAKQVHLR